MNRTIYLQAKVISADILDATVVVEWFLFGDTCFFDNNVNCTSVNIFFDTNFSPSDPRHGNGPYNNNIPTDPIFTLNESYDEFRGSFFRTKLTLFAYDSPYYLSAYPFDIFDAINPGEFSYNTYISAFAQDLATNNSVAISLPASYGVIAQRNEIVVVPIVTLFAFTQLRAYMPGAPEGIGDILDFVGLLPCLLLLSIIAVAMIGIYLFADPDDRCRPALTWRNFKHGFHE
ncbi:hypothetical protein ARMGADRAFT_1039629 [Armillaria gallica]|uniref:Uncharacterized protein n=1 Tax=Armillaria gallica TaxID=47427 RepID=A0A2H3CY69_ARMGA|nr:hypothetical protein ARMGADRAFT_1039629 [Armillaria gallica]